MYGHGIHQRQATMQAAAPTFEAILYPNQSLGRKGCLVFMAVVTGFGAALGAAFVALGAWPVTGFFGLDVVLLCWAFRRVQRDSRRRELIRLDRDGLTVRRVEPDGRSREWRFEPYWAKVCMDDPPRRHSRLMIASHGARLVIGDFLTLDERVELARTLTGALRAHR